MHLNMRTSKTTSEKYSSILFEQIPKTWHYSAEASKSCIFNFDQNLDYFIKPIYRSAFLKPSQIVFLLT